MRKLLPAVLLFLLLQSVGYCTTIGEAKALPVDTPVTVQGVVTYLETQECYIQSADAPIGIWVSGSMDSINLNEVVDAVGTIAVVNGEKAISNAVVTKTGQTKTIIPVSMANKSIAGASLEPALPVWDYLKVKNDIGVMEWKWLKATGGNNTGLFVKAWGRVKATYYSPTNNVKWFYMDDGSGIVSDLGDKGVLVYSDANVKEGDAVTVNGISSTEPSIDDSSKLVRVIRPARTSDVQIEKEYQPLQPPFSDEFDRSTLSQFWRAYYYVSPYRTINNSVSLSLEPGNVALCSPYPDDMPLSNDRVELIQFVYGNWDLDIKARVDISSSISIYDDQAFGIRLKPTAISDLYNNPWNSTILIAGIGYYSYSGIKVAHQSSTSDGWQTLPYTGGYVYFHIRRRQPNIYISLSLDGIDFTQETCVTDKGYRWISFYVYNRTNDATGVQSPITAYIDYCRFTKVTE